MVKRSEMRVSRNKFYVGLASLLVVPYVFTVTKVIFAWRAQNTSSDISNYVSGYDRYVKYIADRTETWLDYIVNEAVFHYLYYEMSEFFGDPFVALQVIAGVSSTIIFLALLPQNSSQIIYLVFLLHPRVLDLLSSQNRFALAIATFILVLKYSQSRFRGLFVSPLATIHTFFLAASAFVLFFDRYMVRRSLILAYIQIVAIAFVLVFGAEVILSFLGDRRAESLDVNKSFGLAYLAMTTLTYGAIVYTNRKIVMDLFGFLFVLTGTLAVFTALMGGYAERFVTASLLFFLAYSSKNRIRSSNLVLFVLLVNLTLSLFYWL